jgi:hypothetical protein
LTYRRSDEPDTIDVTACSLDDADPVEPEDHVWSIRMVPWVKFADRLPQFERGRFGSGGPSGGQV